MHVELEQLPFIAGTIITDDAFFIKKAASSAFPLFRSLFFREVFVVSSVAPNPPKITLKNERFIPLHMIYDKIAPEDQQVLQ